MTDPRLPAIREQLATTAGELVAHVDARDVGISFIGVGAATLRQSCGHAEAIAVLRQIADALELQGAGP